MKLMQPNGTTLSDKVHDLLIYRIDNKKFVENDASYLDTLPSTREELAELVSSVDALVMHFSAGVHRHYLRLKVASR